MQKGTKAEGTASSMAGPVLTKSQVMNRAAGGGQPRSSPAAFAADSRRFNAMGLALISLEDENQFVSEITRLWLEAQERFLLIGRYLVQAQERLGKDRYFRLVNSEAFPLSRSIAYKLRIIADGVDGGKLPSDRLPRDYAVAYMLVTLTDEQLQQAKDRNLVHVDVKRRDVEEFRRSLRQNIGKRRIELVKKRDSLLAKIRQMRDELRRVQAELGGDVIDGEAVEVDEELTDA